MAAVSCPHCGASVAFVPELVGRPVLCPSCQQKFPMEQPPSPAAPATAPVIIHNYVSPTISTSSHSSSAARSEARATAIAGSSTGCIGCAVLLLLMPVACGGCFMMMAPSVEEPKPAPQPVRVAPRREATLPVAAQSPKLTDSPEKLPAVAEDPPAPQSADRRLHSWTSADGNFTTEAQFLSMTAGKVKLKKRDGTVVEVPLEKLSEDDQRYISSGEYKK